MGKEKRLFHVAFILLAGPTRIDGFFVPNKFFVPPENKRYEMSRISTASEGDVNQILTDLLDELDVGNATLTDKLVNDDIDCINDETVGSKARKTRSRSQIKTLKFLMNQDVEKLMHDKDPSAVERAHKNIQKLQRLWKEEQNPCYKPTTLNYNVLIRALAKSGSENAPTLAEKVLEEMESDGVLPDAITYTEVINAYARSKDRTAADKAEKILYQMMERLEENSEGMGDLALSSVTCDAGKSSYQTPFLESLNFVY